MSKYVEKKGEEESVCFSPILNRNNNYFEPSVNEFDLIKENKPETISQCERPVSFISVCFHYF